MPTSRDELLRPVLPEDALYGLPGRVALKLSESTGADPASILGMFMACFGNAIGRQPHVMFYGHDEPGLLFTLIVGKWARGRKGTAWNAVKKLFEQAEPDWSAKDIESGLQSSEAMIEAVADSPNGDPRLLILETEFARFIAAMSAQRKFAARMRAAYDGDTLAARRVKQPPLISTQHMISIIGMITPGELLALQKMSGGLESRMLYFYSAPARKTKTDPFKVDQDEINLADEVREAIGHAWDSILVSCGPITAELIELRGIAPSTKFPINDDVVERWKDEIEPAVEDIANAVGADYERYTARAQTHVIRLSLLYALADGASEIGWPHVKAAMALTEFCMFSARRIFSVPDDPKPKISPLQEGKVFDFLLEIALAAEESGDEDEAWASGVEITNDVLSNNTPSTPILEDLEEQQLIQKRTVHTGRQGKPRVEYRAVINSSFTS
ncbi:MAG TPA: DUF3987 domain-containing protein [Nitrospiraceae bacterium]|nr:DUF3987 domain-containing protein [Nitrospiraceae bacterium]